jgi:hypothetical protein
MASERWVARQQLQRSRLQPGGLERQHVLIHQRPRHGKGVHLQVAVLLADLLPAQVGVLGREGHFLAGLMPHSILQQRGLNGRQRQDAGQGSVTGEAGDHPVARHLMLGQQASQRLPHCRSIGDQSLGHLGRGQLNRLPGRDHVAAGDQHPDGVPVEAQRQSFLGHRVLTPP